MEQGDHSLTRRDVVKGAAKVGVAGAAIAWVAPKFDSVAYAAGSTGSPPPDTSTTTTTGGGTGDEVTCRVDPIVLAVSRLPFRIRVIGTHWAPSSKVRIVIVGSRLLGIITTQPNGSFDTRVEVPDSMRAGKYRIEMAGFDAKGKAHRCFRDFELSDGRLNSQGGTTSTTSSGGKPGSNGTGNGSGTLPNTGSDSRTLLLVGAGAVVAGRSLYALRNRLATASADGDAHSR